MYLQELKLWNFRRFGSEQPFDIRRPDLSVSFVKGVNLLVGQNDSGKTAIIDAIKLVVHTHSNEWIRVEHEDFYSNQSKLRVDCIFGDLSDDEAKNFIEWLSWSGEGPAIKPLLRVYLEVERVGERILSYESKAGSDTEGYTLSAEARSYLRATYLRPLRDAKNELTPRKNSRLSQILLSHEAFLPGNGDHEFVSAVRSLNTGIEKYFQGVNAEDQPLPDQRGKQLKDRIDNYLDRFSNKKSKFQMNGSTLRSILESLCLLFEEGINLGLGSHNILVIASELLHLQKSDWSGLRLGLIEEIEAHLHPQVQLQVMETLQRETVQAGVQLIFTTHSPNIASKVPLSNLLVCQNKLVFSIQSGKTNLARTDYTFLERFLDVTKANLFFADGIILVEGWAEEQLLPALAQKIGVDLTKAGVSIINVGSTAFLRYSKIFQRSGEERMNIRVAVITDVDVRPIEDAPKKRTRNEENQWVSEPMTEVEIEEQRQNQLAGKEAKYTVQTSKGFISPYWTLEYCIAMSSKLRKLFYKSVLMALKDEKEDDGVANLDDYDTAINNIDTYFNNWQDADVTIAQKIMHHILTGENDAGVAEMKISKSVIAQIFAKNLTGDPGIVDLHTEPTIGYLLNAIKYAANIE